MSSQVRLECFGEEVVQAHEEDSWMGAVSDSSSFV